MDYSPKDSAKAIKTALKKEYKKVSVTCARGTAWGWIDAVVTVERPINCQCNFSNVTWKGEPCNEHRTSTYCASCSAKHSKETEKSEKIAYEAMKANKMKFGTFLSDDHCDTVNYSKFNTTIDIL